MAFGGTGEVQTELIDDGDDQERCTEGRGAAASPRAWIQGSLRDGTISRRDYAAMYGPTKGDAVRLGDTALLAEIEHDYNVPGDECLHGGGRRCETALA